MRSKYDVFWAARIGELSSAIERAAAGRSATVDVAAIRTLGARQSWYGNVTIHGGEAEPAPMAQMRSLGRIVAESGGCSRWPELGFTFTMSADGTRLTITGAKLGAPPASRISIPLEAVDMPLPPASMSSTESREVNPTHACAEIHQVLTGLPSYTDPNSVPFGNGLYFFYEEGERSAHGPSGRIVRIGNHPRAQDRLVGRLRDHYRSGIGAKNGSVFRRYLGGAIMRSHDPRSQCLSPGPGFGHWERQDEPPCPNCSPVEAAVSHLLAERFSFRCVRIDNRDERNHLEARLIATVAACTECEASPGWLGAYAYPKPVHRSGLWNTQHVGGPTATADDLACLRRRVSSTPPSETHMRSLSDTLLLIPCSGAKAGAADPGLPVARIEELLSPKAVTMLTEGRKLAFERPGVLIDHASPLRPALAWYTGQPYATPGVRDGLIAAIRRGVHCLIVSGGYGVVRAEEPVHAYQAHLPTQTRTVWSRRLPGILRDYVAHNGITRTITTVSSGYAAVIPTSLTDDDIRYVPSFTRGVDQGAALQVVPARVGQQLSEVLGQL